MIHQTVAAPVAGAWRVVNRGAPGWPDRLEHLPQPPARLWLLGEAAPHERAVAVVGSRAATLAGLDVARWLGRELATAGVQVISGLALGIDGAAHRGALEGGGTTVAVLGCGIDICYPRRHLELSRAVVARGAMITEEPPGTSPHAGHFPKRNRIIAALALAVVVVEAAERSGALSTARHAADLGREVLAVPGSIRNPSAVGSNLLIRDGATPLLRLDDLFVAIPALRPGPDLAPAVASAGSTGDAPARRGGALAEVLRLLGTDPVHPDALAEELRLPAPVIAARLTVMEVEGLIRTLPGGKVVRLPGRGPRTTTPGISGPTGPAVGARGTLGGPLL